MLPAQFIGNFLYLLKVGFHVAAQLLAVQKGHRIDCDVVMQVMFIQMGADDHLKPLTEHPFGKLHADGMGLLWGQLTRLERLDDMIALHAARLVVTPFSALHITAGVFHAAAIQTDFKQSLLGLIWVYGVVDHAVQRGLLLIGGILDGFLKTGTDGKNFGDCHIRTI